MHYIVTESRLRQMANWLECYNRGLGKINIQENIKIIDKKEKSLYGKMKSLKQKLPATPG